MNAHKCFTCDRWWSPLDWLLAKMGKPVTNQTCWECREDVLGEEAPPMPAWVGYVYVFSFGVLVGCLVKDLLVY